MCILTNFDKYVIIKISKLYGLFSEGVCMFNIIIELYDVEDKLSEVAMYFDEAYEKWWLESDIAKEIIKDVDSSEYIGGECIMSPVFGMISPRDLSTGCKACLVLLNEPEHIVSGERFGDNCFKWLSKIGEQQDITITLSHFIDDYDIPIDAVVLNDNRHIASVEELNNAILELSEGL